MTDIVRHTAFADYARGWSNIGITLVNFAVIWTLLYGKPRRLELYGWGLVVGSLLTISLNPSEFTLDIPWKFGFAYPVTLGVFLLASHEKWRSRWPIAMIAMTGVINMAMGSRNTGGVCLAAALYLLVADFLRKKAKAGSKLKAGTVLALAVFIIVGSIGILQAYQYAARSGYLGEDAQTKVSKWKPVGNTGCSLAVGRNFWRRFPPFTIRPLLGHGSWAKNRIYYIGEVRALVLLRYKGARIYRGMN